MPIEQVKVLGIRLDILRKKDALSIIRAVLGGSSGQCHVATVNAEFVMESLNRERFKKILDQTYLNLADGIGPIWAAKYLSIRLKSRGVVRVFMAIWQMIYSGASLLFWPNYVRQIIPDRIGGIDTMLDICRMAESYGKKVFLLGGSLVDPSTPRKTEIELCRLYPKLEFKHLDGPVLTLEGEYNQDENDKVIDEIVDFSPEVLFVAFSHPKAQYWIEDNLKDISTVKIAIGVGGSFEFIGKSIKRAPIILRYLGVEWLWRLILQPKRLPRIFTATVRFISAVVKSKINLIR